MRRRKQDDLTIERSAIRFGGDTPAAKDDDPVGHTNHFLRIVADEDDGHSLGCQLRNSTMDFGLGPDVNTARRLIENEDFWRRNKPFGPTILSSAGCRPERVSVRRSTPVATTRIRSKKSPAICFSLVR